MIKTRILALALLAFAVSASAAVVSPETAAQAVRTWARRGGHFRGRMGKVVERTVRHETDGGFFYAVKMKGGGTVFTSGDDENEPVIAFTTGDGDFSKIDRRSPLWALLNGDARGRRRAPARHRRTWRRLARENDSGSDEPVAFAAAGTSPARTAVSDLRVDALVKSKWGQHSGIWNYYTPEVDDPNTGGKVRCYCGCVATALAQIMRYLHGPVTDGGLGIPFPLAEVPPESFVCYVNDEHTELTTQGGTYAWDNMPLVPKAAGFTPTEAQKQNIGKLTSDVGISLWMSYKRTSSGTYLMHVPGTLIHYYGYNQAVLYSLDGGWEYLTGDEDDIVLHGALFANFDAGRPCQLLIPNHSIVADGYGYEDEVPYVHLNMGWADQNDIWYNLPDMTKAGKGFNAIKEIAYNIFPEIGGVTKQGQTTHAILSGRVLRHDGVPFKGGTVTIRKTGTSEVVATVTSSATGVWAAILPAGTYDLLAEAADGVVTAEKTGVELKVADTMIEYGFAKSPSVKIDGSDKSALPPGNSWGNDLVLSDVLEESYIRFTYDTRVADQANEGEGGTAAVAWQGRDGTPRFIEEEGRTAVCAAETYYKDMKDLGNEFAIGLAFKAVADPMQCVFHFGSLRTDMESLLVMTKSRNEIELIVEKHSMPKTGLQIQRRTTIAVDDVTKFHSYLLRYRSTGEIWVEVDGVFKGSILFAYGGQSWMQTLGAYYKDGYFTSFSQGYYDAGNALDDVRIWKRELTDKERAEYARVFGVRAAPKPMPAGYAKRDFIESHGQECIDTGVLGTEATKVTMDFTFVKQNGSVDEVLFGAWQYNGASAMSFGLYVFKGSVDSVLKTGTKGDFHQGDYAWVPGTRYFAELDAPQRLVTLSTVDAAGAKTKVYDYTHPSALADLQTDGTIPLCAGRQNGGLLTARCSCLRIYSATITEGGVPVRSFVPCRSDRGEVGLWDSVEGKFYCNASGAGRFTDYEPADVTTATWTGKGDRAKLDDPANWICRNPSGETIPDAVPFAGSTAVFVTGETSFSFPVGSTPVWKSLTVNGAVTLTADCDWRGLGDVCGGFVAAGATINLRGHELRVAAAGNPVRSIGVTDDSPQGKGGHLYVDVGARVVQQGERVIAWTAKPAAGVSFRIVGSRIRENLLPRAAADGLYYDLSDPAVVSDATWTGGGDRAKLDDPRNWICMNARGETLPNAVPSAGTTAAVVTGETSFSFPVGSTPVWKSLTVNDTVKLTADCDWRGLGNACGGFIAADTTINLKGHELRVAAEGNPGGRVNVTDNSPQGEGGRFRIDVAAGKTFSNRGESDDSWNSDRMFWFSGSVECVKDGAGTYVPANAYDPTSPDDKWMAYAHTGGTTVHEGLLRMNNDDENGNDTRFAQNHRPVFGAYGSDLRIDAGGTLDYRGVYDIWHYKTYLNGGTIRNTRKPGNLSWDAFGDLSFEADSSFDIARTAQLGGYFHLNGHTLTATIAKDQDWYCKDGSGENGTIVIRGEGTFHSYGHLIDAPTVTFDVATAMSVDMEMTVKDYIARYEGAVKGSGTAALNVVGTFRPVTQNFYPCTMRNGSTIDLSAKAGTWNSTGAFGAVRYASGAAVTVDVGARALQPGERVIAWTAKPAEGVSFRLVGSGILSNLTPQIKADGLYYDLVLADNCDWREIAAPVSGRVDLNGHKLTLSTLAGLEAVTGAGELHLFVPAGETVTDADLPLSGALKLVKEGAGTYVASRTGQSYTGGTVIRAGLCETPAGTGHSADPAANERYLGAVGSEVRVEGGSLYIRGDYNHKVYSIVSRGGAVRIESMSGEGSPILVEANPETSMSWHTLTAAKGIAWEWPERALSARLTARPSVGKAVSEVLTDRSVCSYAFNPALPDSAESERTYALRLDFFATLDATGTPIAGESLTAENIGVVRGVDGAVGDLIGRGAEDPEWDDVYGRSVVLPIPAGSTSLSVNGEPVKPELDGSFGWRAIRPFVNKRICNLLLEGAEPAEATLTGHNVMPTVLIVR